MGAFDAIVRKFLYYPSSLERDAPLPSYAADAREVFFDSDGGVVLHALHWQAPEGRPTLLFFHGNAETVFEWALIRQELTPMDCGLLLIDYPGYGKSTGSPSEEALYAAGQASIDYLATKVGVSADQIVVFGKSLGGGVATKVAIEHDVLGVVLESTFRSIPSVIRRLIPIVPAGALLKTERYESLSRIGAIRSPILVVHGTQDQLIPLREGQALYDAAPEPKDLYLVEGAGHNDVSWLAGAAYGETLRRWLDGITS